MDEARLAAYRPSYRFLSYVLEEAGKAARPDRAGVDRPDLIEALHKADEAWLNGRSMTGAGAMDMKIRTILGGLVAGAVWLGASAAFAETYTLLATPRTVAWGNYNAAAKPVLTIRSGDTVVFHTLLTNSPAGLAKAGVPDDQIEQALKDVFREVTDKGPGGHILNGPVAIEGAEPGDTIEVRILKIDLAIPYAYNAFRYGAGFQTEEFPYARMKIIPLDRRR